MNFAGTMLILMGLLLLSGTTKLIMAEESSQATVTAHCLSWRLNVEANNLRHWKVVPEECIEYVGTYMLNGDYERDLAAVIEQAVIYARQFSPGEDDGRDAWVLDVDETALSNLEYYKTRKFGGELFNQDAFNSWVFSGNSPALTATLELYQQLIKLGFRVFFITGRDESQREITQDNLISQGFTKWDGLILRSESDHGDSAVVFKSRKREELIKKGYRIWGNGGDQWSDVIGNSVGARVFKLPNPMYFIS
ncbi:hypothetical protein SUGI_0501650 [Cryptomeria japonica]|uniref:acid phosphatase 1 n=1 Tax=Cryptomeria japonica TaxID=3369 RepID=UPI002408D2B5|nr:acid phosphatase 1 [Cryptomeria japonica]GLJ26160.1 hypothetical protein SUGI_0501650 [Cryptomeria japonica]